MTGEPIRAVIRDTGRTDAMLEAVTAAIEARRISIEADPTIATVTLILRLDRRPNGEPDVLFRTEARTH